MLKGANFQFSATNRGGAAMSSFEKGLKNVKKAQDKVRRSNGGFMKGMNANRRIIQQVGFQVSDLGVQIAGGQSALLALTQNVPQVVQMFGAWGGILAGLITLMGTFAILLVKSGKGFADIAPMLGITREELAQLGAVLNRVKERMIDFANVIINNLDVLMISLTLYAAFLTGRFVTASIASGKATMFFGKSLIFLRKMLVRTGIGALIVTMGYMVERLFTLKKATGSWAATIKLLGDVAKQTFGQIPVFLTAMNFKFKAATTDMAAAWKEFLVGATIVLTTWANNVIGKIVGTAKSTVDILKGAATAASALVRGDITTAATIGSTIGAATKKNFEEALDKTYVSGGSVVERLVGEAGQLKEASNKLSVLGDKLFGSAANAIPAWAELKRLMASVQGDDFDIRNVFGEGGKKKGLSEAEKKRLEDYKRRMRIEQKWLVKRLKEDNRSWEQANAKRLADHKRRMSAEQKILVAKFKLENKLWEEQQERIARIRDRFKDSFKDMFKGLVTGSLSLKDAVVNVLSAIANRAAEMAASGIFDAIFKPGSFGGSGNGLFSGLASFAAKIFSFDGGGFTGQGSRSGGVDGKGGFPAILHPNETVVDHTKTQRNKNHGDMSRIGMGYQPANDRGGMSIVNNNYFNGVTREEVMRDVEQSQKDMKKQMDNELPGRINKHRFNQGRGMG